MYPENFSCLSHICHDFLPAAGFNRFTICRGLTIIPETHGIPAKEIIVDSQLSNVSSKTLPSSIQTKAIFVMNFLRLSQSHQDFF